MSAHEPAGIASIDPATLSALREMTGNDAAFLAELIDSYLEDAPLQLEAMEHAIEAGSAEELVRPAHTLKGNSASMGALGFSEQCLALEQLGKSGSLDGASEYLDAAATEFERVRSELLALRAAELGE